METNRTLGKVAALSALLAGTAVCGAAPAQTAAPAQASAAHRPGKAMPSCRTLRADAGWRGTGVAVNPNQFVCVAADGLWSHGIQGIQAITPFYGAEGFAKDDPANVPEVVARVGALIGRIGTNPPFVVGKQLCFIPSTAGDLMLSMNDDPGAFESPRVHYMAINQGAATPSGRACPFANAEPTRSLSALRTLSPDSTR